MCIKFQSTSIKGKNYAANLRNITGRNTNIDIVNIIVYKNFGYILSTLKKLGGNEVLMPIKGHNFVSNL